MMQPPADRPALPRQGRQPSQVRQIRKVGDGGSSADGDRRIAVATARLRSHVVVLRITGPGRPG
eukprot:837556-Alexandrium_andersonii.AAC.1